MTDERFFGTWKLQSVVRIGAEGQISKPFGENPLGYITYLPDGFMHAILMKSDRRLTGVAPEELRDAARSKKLFLSWKHLRAGIRYLKAVTSFLSYCGTYEVRDSVVIHHVKAAMVPDWIGTDLTREFSFSGDLLTLTARDTAGNTMVLIWKRVSPESAG
ncbi:MAG TPA: lipocalin-like domain-containing protein [Smithella sp.]|nr:lipocalin-like domain-containing protein [Smithella sp.]HRS97905.1 lipocalin-like domain-containing protein [Smithella sp.]